MDSVQLRRIRGFTGRQNEGLIDKVQTNEVESLDEFVN